MIRRNRRGASPREVAGGTACLRTHKCSWGGNSGSPVINGKGELIGLAFDGNWEAVVGDYIFQDPLNRAINVDARYVLFILDKYSDAKNILSELRVQ